jgi:hypothetical protein
MAEPEQEHDPRVDTILRLAVSAAGPVTDSPGRWRDKVMTLVGEVTNIFADGSPEHQYAYLLLNSPTITGTFTGREFNSNAKRYKVLYTADRSRKGENAAEHIWSYRNHTPLGAIQERMIRDLHKGERIRIWKTLEKHEDRGDDGMTVRTLVHIARIEAGTSEPAGSSPSALPPPARPAESPSAGAPAAAPSAAAGAESQLSSPKVRAAYEALPAPKRVVLARWAMDNGIHNMFDPNLREDKVQAVLVHCELMQQEMI